MLLGPNGTKSSHTVHFHFASFPIPTLQKPLPPVLYLFSFPHLTICFPNPNKVALTSLLQSSPPPPTPDNLRTNSKPPGALYVETQSNA